MKKGYLHGDTHTTMENSGHIFCKVTSADVDRAMREYNRYMKKRGYVYSLDPHKEGNMERFCHIYFGQFDADRWDYSEIPFYLPDVFVCTNKNVAHKMAEFLKPLEYCDNYIQCARDIEVDGKCVHIINSDW